MKVHKVVTKTILKENVEKIVKIFQVHRLQEGFLLLKNVSEETLEKSQVRMQELAVQGETFTMFEIYLDFVCKHFLLTLND